MLTYVRAEFESTMVGMMTQGSSRPEVAVAALARFVHEESSAILVAWKTRVDALPVSGPSLATRGERVLEWLAGSLAAHARGVDPADELPSDDSFSAARAIAELTLLVETIGHLQPAPVTEAARDALHLVIDRAIAFSLARDGDERARLGKRLRLATDVTLVGSWEIERASRAVRADPRSRELLGMTADHEPTVEGFVSHLNADDRERVRDAIAMALDTGRSFMEECRTLLPDAYGPRWIAIAGDVHAALASHSPHLLGIVHDVTDRKRTEAAHARVVEELSRAVHVSEMFIGILSHDLRNPLSAVLAGAQLLRLQTQEERSVRVLSRMVSSGERMARMIDQLLDFTRARIGQGIPLERGPVDLVRLAREVIEEGKASKPASNLRLSVRGDTVGSWDGDRISQILSNLVGNALQHGNLADPIELVVDGEDPKLVSMSIENTGTVPPDLIPVLFNPFRGTLQKRDKSNGLGLGLYVARQIALAHGGDLEVRCSGSTTAFTLRLPRAGLAATPSKQDTVSEQELAAFEHMATPLSASSVTAQMFGASALHERAPLEHSDIVERYRGLLDTALHRKAYRGHGGGIADDLRALAERLGDLGAGPREITEVHTLALKQAVRGVPAAKTAALLSEGRLLALELMGNLASYYRRRARGHLRTDHPAGKGS
jgi:signal transduction histidine kinase